MPFWAITIALASVILLLIFLNLRIRISFLYTRQQNKDHFNVKVRLAGKKIYEVDAPTIDLNISDPSISVTEEQEDLTGSKEKKETFSIKSVKAFMRESKAWIRRFPAYKKGVERFLKRLTIQDFSLKTEFGTGDAALTAQLSGIIWGAATFLIGWVSTKVQWNTQHELVVRPHFQATGYQMSFSCIATFTVGHAISTVLYVLIRYRPTRNRKNVTVSQAEVG